MTRLNRGIDNPRRLRYTSKWRQDAGWKIAGVLLGLMAAPAVGAYVFGKVIQLQTNRLHKSIYGEVFYQPPPPLLSPKPNLPSSNKPIFKPILYLLGGILIGVILGYAAIYFISG